MSARLKHLIMIGKLLVMGVVHKCDPQNLIYKVQARISCAAHFAALEYHRRALMVLESKSYRHA